MFDCLCPSVPLSLCPSVRLSVCPSVCLSDSVHHQEVTSVPESDDEEETGAVTEISPTVTLNCLGLLTATLQVMYCCHFWFPSLIFYHARDRDRVHVHAHTPTPGPQDRPPERQVAHFHGEICGCVCALGDCWDKVCLIVFFSTPISKERSNCRPGLSLSAVPGECQAANVAPVTGLAPTVYTRASTSPATSTTSATSTSVTPVTPTTPGSPHRST